MNKNNITNKGNNFYPYKEVELVKTKDSMEIEQITATVVQVYAGDWPGYFLQWRRETVQDIKNEIREQSDLSTNIKSRLRHLKRK